VLILVIHYCIILMSLNVSLAMMIVFLVLGLKLMNVQVAIWLAIDIYMGQHAMDFVQKILKMSLEYVQISLVDKTVSLAKNHQTIVLLAWEIISYILVQIVLIYAQQATIMIMKIESAENVIQLV